MEEEEALAIVDVIEGRLAPYDGDNAGFMIEEAPECMLVQMWGQVAGPQHRTPLLNVDCILHGGEK